MIDLDGHTVDGADPVGFNPAIHAFDHDFVKIRNGTIRDFAQAVQMSGKGGVLADLVLSSHTGSAVIATSNGGIIRNSTIIDNGGNGISANQSGQTIVGNVIAGNGTDGVDVTNVGTVVEGNTIHGNTGFGIDVPILPTGRFTAKGNSISDNGAGGIRVDIPGKATITGNEVFEDAGTGIDFVNAGGATVRRNVISGDTGGINAAAVDGAVVAGNRVIGGNVGLEWTGDDATISGNRVTASIATGIDYTGERGLLQGNRVLQNGLGITVDSGASKSRVLANVVKGSDGAGIVVSGSSAKIDENVANGNGHDDGNPGAGLGIDASGVTDTVLGKNSAAGNDDPAQCVPASLC